MGKRGPQPRGYKVYQKRYPLELKEKIEQMVNEWLVNNGYKKGDKNG